MCDCLVHLPLLQERVTQVVVRISVVGRDVQSPLVMSDGLVPSALAREGNS